MATKAVEAATEAVTKAVGPNFGRHFRPGWKQVFLPNHVITFVRPRNPAQDPKLATFLVPLQFNKLDFRDYLYHAYNVRVFGVRSFVAQQAPDRRGGAARGRWYRPRPHKYMIAELEKPFVWPDPPPEDQRQEFDHEVWSLMEKAKEETMETEQLRQKGELPLMSKRGEKPEHKAMRTAAERLLSGVETWDNNVVLDEKWEAIKQGEKKTHKEVTGTNASTFEDTFDDSVIVEKDDETPKKS